MNGFARRSTGLLVAAPWPREARNEHPRRDQEDLRHEFVVAGVAAGAGLVVGFYLPHGAKSRKQVFSPNAYVRITPDNKITIVVARSEMGQGIRTALPMILAEELEADWKQIEIEQAGASTLYGDQTTGG